MAEYTLAFDSKVKGWVSFYSYIPENILGMNNYLYTFNRANLFQHNKNELRNVFYGVTDPAKAKSTVTSVINQSPLVNKVFKTFYLESDAAWGAVFNTDVITGYSDVSWFEKKEADWFAFIRTDLLPEKGSGTNYSTSPDLQLRSVNGIGELTNIDTTNPAAWVLTFSSSLVLNPIYIQAVTDVIYNAATAPNPAPLGTVVSFTNSPTTTITIDPTLYSPATPVVGDLMFSVKNTTAESNGLLGNYLEFTLTNTDQVPVELFAVGSDQMTSEPKPTMSNK